MAMLITRRDIEAADRSMRAALRDAGGASHGYSRTGAVLESALGGVSALSFGMLKGYGIVFVPGTDWLPVDALGAVVLHGVALWAKSDYLHAVGNGALYSYLTTLGAGFGVGIANQAGKPTMSGMSRSPNQRWSSGALPAGQKPLTAAELASMAYAVRP